MITKEQWNHLKILENIPLSLFFEYYREVGGRLDTLGEFEKVFIEVMNAQPMIMRNGVVGSVNYNTALSRMFDYYTKKFDL